MTGAFTTMPQKKTGIAGQNVPALGPLVITRVNTVRVGGEEKVFPSLRREDDLHRAVRLLKILHLVLTRPGERRLTKGDLAAECRCSEKTVQRDIRLLAAEFGLYFEASRRAFVLPEGAFPVADLRLSAADVLAFGLTEGFIRNAGFPQQREILAAFAKVTAGLSPPMKRLLEQTTAAVAPAHLPLDYGNAPVAPLLAAARYRRTVEMDYDSANSRTREWRKVDVYAVEPREGVYWELHGWCHNNRAFRTFALDRVHDLKAMPDEFVYRSAEWEQFRSQNAIGGLRGGGDSVRVEARFAPQVARYALRRRWPDPLTAAAQPDGSAILTGAIPGGAALDAMVAELLRWRRHVVVTGGPELLTAMRGELAALTALYE